MARLQSQELHSMDRISPDERRGADIACGGSFLTNDGHPDGAVHCVRLASGTQRGPSIRNDCMLVVLVTDAEGF